MAILYTEPMSGAANHSQSLKAAKLYSSCSEVQPQSFTVKSSIMEFHAASTDGHLCVCCFQRLQGCNYLHFSWTLYFTFVWGSRG